MVNQAYTVSQLTEQIRGQLEQSFPDILVEGEISNYRPSSSGHLYFTLKDSGAALSVVMFKNRLKVLDFRPADGLLVRARGAISVYAQRGSYQLVCERLERTGRGELLALLEDRKRRLAAEGLFEAERKRPLPSFPERVAVITSPTGAAIRDILNVLRRRATVDIIILPTLVQGLEAAPLIVERLRQANAWRLADVLIIARGGGSIEDLLVFSEESVVRAVAASELPVISAIGHEIDWTLTDFAADLRAPTPSAAAELVSPDRQTIQNDIRTRSNLLWQAMEARLSQIRLALKAFSIQDLEFKFRVLIQPQLVRFDDAKENLAEALGQRLDEARLLIKQAENNLIAFNPLAVLERGYSLVTDQATGKVICKVSDIVVGQKLKVRPAEGAYQVKVYDQEELL